MNLIYIILGLVVIGFLIFLVRKFKIIKIPILILVFTALSLATAYCGIELNRYYTAQGGVFGVISGYFDRNQVEVDSLSFDFKNIELKQDSNNQYSASITTSDVCKLSEDENYWVYVNNIPCANVEVGPDYVFADYTYNFYDDNLDLMMSDTLNFKCAFSKTSSTFKLTTSGGAEAVKFWNYYFNANSFTATIQSSDYSQTGDIYIGEGEVPETCYLTYSVDGTESKVLTKVGTSISELTYTPTKEYYKFLGWSADGSNVLTSNYTINQDTTLIAVFELVPGLYTTSDVFVSWNELVEAEFIETAGNTVTSTKNCFGSESYKLSGTLVLPETIKIIGESAFEYCLKLEEVVMPNVEYIDDYAFDTCTSLTNIVLPNTLKEIGSYAFTSCTSLKTLVVPENVTKIGSNAFACCTSLTSISIPNNSDFKYLGSWVQGCSSLQSFKIPDSITKIDCNSFQGCSSLTSIYIPKNVEKIQLEVAGTVIEATYERSVFLNCSEHLVIYCEADSKPSNWHDYWNYYSSTNKLTVKWGYSYDQYLAETN